jgi:lipid II:glycine glycyltransferase (peptidoglycan interpeptide bridge formation enzyme)
MSTAAAPSELWPPVGAASPHVVRLDRAEWEAAVPQFRDYSYRQTWAYGEKLADKRGAKSEHVAVRRGGETIALADVRIKALPIIGGGLAYISGGPLVRSIHGASDELHRLELAIDALAREFVQRRGLTLRVAPPIGLAEHNEAVAQRFERADFVASPNSARYQTVLLDVERPVDGIRASFHKHWRRHLNGALRNDLEMTFGTEPDRLEVVDRMSEATRERKGYELDLDAGFYADVQRELSEQDELVVGLVTKDGTPVAANITAIHGDTAVYLIGASTEEGLACKAGYLMHWRTIELLRERSVPWYDLGGIDPVANPGVTSFKLRTNGADVTAAGPFDLAPGGLRGRVTGWAERAYVRAKRAGVKA